MCTLQLIVDRQMGAIEAMTASWNALKREWLAAAAFFFVATIISYIGIVACGVGLLVSFPVGTLCFGIVYRDIFGNPSASVVPAEPVAPAGTPGAFTDEPHAL